MRDKEEVRSFRSITKKLKGNKLVKQPVW